MFNEKAFATLLRTPEGQAIWDLIHTERCRTQMLAATQLGRPAVEILDQDLVRVCPAIAKPRPGASETVQEKRHRDVLKRFVGNVAGDIMFRLGARIQRQGVRIRKANLVFQTGTVFAFDQEIPYDFSPNL